MIVLGLDPGWANIGLALVERSGRGFHAVDMRSLDLSKVSPGERLESVWRQLHLTGWDADVIAVEDQRQAQVAQAKRGQFTHSNSRINEVVGIVHAYAYNQGVALVELSPATWKKTIGAGGRADKAATSRAVRLLLPDLPRCSQHARDAAGVALAALMRAGAKGVAA